MEVVKDQGDEALYDKLDSAYPTDDEESEVPPSLPPSYARMHTHTHTKLRNIS